MITVREVYSHFREFEIRLNEQELHDVQTALYYWNTFHNNGGEMTFFKLIAKINAAINRT